MANVNDYRNQYTEDYELKKKEADRLKKSLEDFTEAQAAMNFNPVTTTKGFGDFPGISQASVLSPLAQLGTAFIGKKVRNKADKADLESETARQIAYAEALRRINGGGNAAAAPAAAGGPMPVVSAGPLPTGVPPVNVGAGPAITPPPPRRVAPPATPPPAAATTPAPGGGLNVAGQGVTPTTIGGPGGAPVNPTDGSSQIAAGGAGVTDSGGAPQPPSDQPEFPREHRLTPEMVLNLSRLGVDTKTIAEMQPKNDALGAILQGANSIGSIKALRSMGYITDAQEASMLEEVKAAEERDLQKEIMLAQIQASRPQLPTMASIAYGDPGRYAGILAAQSAAQEDRAANIAQAKLDRAAVDALPDIKSQMNFARKIVEKAKSHWYTTPLGRGASQWIEKGTGLSIPNISDNQARVDTQDLANLQLAALRVLRGLGAASEVESNKAFTTVPSIYDAPEDRKSMAEEIYRVLQVHEAKAHAAMTRLPPPRRGMEAGTQAGAAGPEIPKPDLGPAGGGNTGGTAPNRSKLFERLD